MSFKEGLSSNKFLICFYCFLFSVLMLRIANASFDTDMYHILTEGRNVFETGHASFENLQNVVPGLSIIAQEWLYGYFLFLIYRLMGFGGFFLVVSVFTIILVFLIIKILNIKNIKGNTFFAVLIVIIVLLNTVISIRPYLLSFILFFAEILCLELYIKNKKPWYLLFIPLLTIFEVNVHASFWIVHLAILIPYLLPAIKGFMVKTDYKKMPLFYMALLSCLAAFVNPYGADGVLYVFYSYGQINDLGISELQTPSTDLGYTWIYIAIIVFFVAYLTKKRKISSIAFYMFIGTFIPFAFNIRNFVFCTLGACYLMLDNQMIMDMTQKLSKIKSINMGLINKILLSLSACILAISILSGISNIPPEDNSASKYISSQTSSKDINVFTTFNTGAFMEFKGYKVYFDARPEIYSKEINKKEDILSEYKKICDGNKDVIDNLFNNYDFDYACVENTKEAKIINYYLKEKTDWRLVVEDKEYNLYEYAG